MYVYPLVAQGTNGTQRVLIKDYVLHDACIVLILVSK